MKAVATYTRRQAIADGFLVDLSPICRGNGFNVPVAVTSAAWAAALQAPRADGIPSDIDIGRFLLWLRVTIQTKAATEPHLDRCQAVFRKIDQSEVALKVTCGPGDQREPVITVMLPEED